MTIVLFDVVFFFFTMQRVKSRVRPKRTFLKKDTPLKSSLPWINKLGKPLFNAIHEEVPEEAVVEHINTTPIAKTCVPLMGRDLFKGCPTEAEKEENQSSGSVSTPSLVEPTSYSSDKESSLSDTSSTMDSPEVFREEHCVDSSFFGVKDPTHRYLPIKNSTLLDLSHAKDILMHKPPNVSTIMDPPNPAENTNEISNKRQPIDDECKIVKVTRSEKKRHQTKQPSPVFRKSIFFKKKVYFRSPLLSEKSRRESPKTITPDPEALKVDERNLKEGGIFFDFTSDVEQNDYFQKIRERCTKLKNAALFPSTAVRHKESAVYCNSCHIKLNS